MDILESKYMDDINSGKLVDDAINEVLTQLDPHSVYFSEDELKQANEPLEGNFEGVGIQFNILKDTINVVNTISGGPSEKVGILSGDKIVVIDGENVAGTGINNKGVMDRLRGKKGTVVDVEISRRGSKKNLEFKITRDIIPLYSIDASYMISPEIGYIRLSKFSATTTEEFKQAITELKAEGMKNLIFDLRGNGGGYLNAAIDISDEFLPSGKLIVYTEGRAYPRQDAVATSVGSMETGKVVVLIDEGSASASEIVSGALQDWDRALVIGRRSFGKGLVQRPFNLTDGSAIRLTVSRYYTPSGRSIQKPYDEGLDVYAEELGHRLSDGELTADSLIAFPDSLKYFTSGDRIVYGGGGIMPDIYIALDTSWATDYYAQVVGKGIVNQFALEYINDNRNEFKTMYPTPFDFNSKFEVNKEVWDKFFKYAEGEEVPYDEEQYKTCEMKLTQILKASLARDLYDFEAFWIVYNSYDDAYKKAIESLNDDTFSKMKIAVN
ncbi:MAG: S41 family peptidase [Bacteroidetes bacterium]|nr:S41 family peptidase [Bacteroidota bacterium]MBK7110652.1 S41 family peptidase [Bacteroidota bacterium]MBK8682115.1 S41 family peptidase [Bacteroidota bacterium]